MGGVEGQCRKRLSRQGAIAAIQIREKWSFCTQNTEHQFCNLSEIEGSQLDGWVQGWPKDRCICRSRHPSKRAILYTFLLPVEMCMVRILEDCAEHKKILENAAAW